MEGRKEVDNTNITIETRKINLKKVFGFYLPLHNQNSPKKTHMKRILSRNIESIQNKNKN